jgi:hypothetical protein
MSNIWESVQRGLEKASQEAARIARTQKLRSAIDALSRQINTENAALLNKAMELYNTEQMTQSELLPICQELAVLKQQLEQAQFELKLLQSQVTTQPTPPHPFAGELPTNTCVPPPPPSNLSPESTTSIPIPPPPPQTGSPSVSELATLTMGSPGHPPSQPSWSGQQCPHCHSKIISSTIYCPHCGARVEESQLEYLPTVQGGMPETTEHLKDGGQ